MEKTKYYTTENIGYKSKAFLDTLKHKVLLHYDIFDIDKAALLILDMQRFFFEEKSHAYIPSGKAIIDGIVNIAKLFDINNRPIITTKHINTKTNAKMMDNWWRDILTNDSDYSNLIDEIENIPNSKVLIKSQYDAFFKTDLHQLLQEQKIEQILITGVITHLCCETTARSAFVHGYNVFVPIDGTATYNKDIHLSSLHTLAHGFANITTNQKITEAIVE